MTRKFLGLALAGCFAAGSLTATARAADSGDAKEQVMNVLRDWVKAENAHDAAALNRILDDKFITTSGSGAPHDKDYFIKALTKGKADPAQSQSLTDESVVVEGDTAVVVGTDTFHMANHAKPDGLALRYTITFIRRDGRWLALAEHIVAMPK
jgi:ketosteroid isomerase-like protein